MCCTVCKSGPRGGACVLYCLQIWPPVAPMCCTVCKSGPRWRQCAVLSPNLAPGKAPMCCTVCTSGSRGEPMWCTVCKSCPRGRQCRVLSPNLAPGCANVLHCLPTWPPKAPIRGRCASVRVCACAGVGVLGRGTGISGKEITKGMTKKIGGANVLYCLQIWPRGGPWSEVPRIPSEAPRAPSRVLASCGRRLPSVLLLNLEHELVLRS